MVFGQSIWDGDVDGNWNTGGNWGTNAVPSPGDSLAFGGTVNTVTTNDIADGFLVGSIMLANTNHGEGFILGGDSITLGGALDVGIDMNTATTGTDAVVHDIIDLDIDVSGNRTIWARSNTAHGPGTNEYHHVTINGTISGDRITKNGGGILTLNAANSNAGFYIANGRLLANHNEALGPTNALSGTGGTLELANGITVSDPLTVLNAGGNKVLRMSSGTNNVAEYAGTITLEEDASGNFDINPNAPSGDFNTNQVLTISGRITGTGFASDEYAIEIRTRGTVNLTNPSNDFTGDINLQNRGATLRVATNGVVSDATIWMNHRNTSLLLVKGVTFGNAVVVTDNNAHKTIRLERGTGQSAEVSGPITVDEMGKDNFEAHMNGTAKNDANQVLTLSGPIVSTNGAGLEVLGNGVLALSNPSNDITGIIHVNNKGSTLRVMHGGALGSSDGNTMVINHASGWIELADGVTTPTHTTYQQNDEGATAHGLRIYNAQDGIAETATFTGPIVSKENVTTHARLQVNDEEDTLFITGVMSGTRLSSSGDGTVVFDGAAANTLSNGFSLGTGAAASTWDGVSRGNKRGFVVVHRADAFGTGPILGRGSQLQAAQSGLMIPNSISLFSRDLRLGGTNDFELSGNIGWGQAGNRAVGHYGLEGVTYTLSGDIDLSERLEIQGSDDADNGTIVLSGDISGPGDLWVDYTFQEGEVYLTGDNSSRTGRVVIEHAVVHVGSEANLGGNPGAFDADALEMNSNEPVTLHATNTFAIDDSNRGILVGGDRDSIFDVDAAKTLTIGVSNVISGSGSGAFAKTGDGTLVLQAGNTFTCDVDVVSGTLALDSGAAIVDSIPVTVSDAATLRIDSSETLATLHCTGALEINGATLTLPPGTANTIDGPVAGNGTLILGDGSTLMGEQIGPAATIVFGASTGITFYADGSTTNALTAGTLDISSGTQTLMLAQMPTSGVFTVANYGTLNGGLGNLLLVNSNNFRNVSLLDTGSSITLNIGNEEHTWGNGVGNRVWDIGGSANWTSGDGLFYDGDSVTFGDTAAGSVTLTEDVSPRAVLFSNTSGNDYTVDGSASATLTVTSGIEINGAGSVTMNNTIAGATPITHAGSGILELAGTNTFTGVITVEAGATLKAVFGDKDNVGTTRSLGDTQRAHTMTVEPGGTFDVGGDHNFKSYLGGSIVVSGHGVGGNGAIINTGANASQAFGDEITLAGDVTFGGANRWDIDSAMRSTADGIQVTKIGNSFIEFGGNNRNTSITNFLVNAGTFQANHDGAFGNASVVINAGAILQVWNNRTLDNTIVLNGGRISHGQDDKFVSLTGPISVIADSRIDPNTNRRRIVIAGTLSGTNRLDIGNGTNDLTGDISGFTGLMNLDEAGTVLGMDGTANAIVSITAVAGSVIENGNANPGSITLGGDNADVALPTVFRDGAGGGALSVVKVGSGTLSLSGVNTYAGTTSVEAGTLLLSSDSTNMTGTVTVQSGALFGGAGSVGGAVVLEDGAGLSVELNDTDVTFECATLTLNELDITECEITIEGGHSLMSEYVLIEAASSVTGDVTDSKLTISGGSGGRLAVEGNQLILQMVPASTVFVVR